MLWPNAGPGVTHREANQGTASVAGRRWGAGGQVACARFHCPLTPALSPSVGEGGTPWIRALIYSGRDRQSAAAGHGVAGVDGQIHKNLREHVFIGLDDGRSLRTFALQRNVLADDPSQHLAQAPN